MNYSNNEVRANVQMNEVRATSIFDVFEINLFQAKSSYGKRWS